MKKKAKENKITARAWDPAPIDNFKCELYDWHITKRQPSTEHFYGAEMWSSELMWLFSDSCWYSVRSVVLLQWTVASVGSFKGLYPDFGNVKRLRCPVLTNRSLFSENVPLWPLTSMKWTHNLWLHLIRTPQRFRSEFSGSHNVLLQYFRDDTCTVHKGVVQALVTVTK